MLTRNKRMKSVDFVDDGEKHFGKNKIKEQDFPGGSVVKNPPASAGDMDSTPAPGRSHMPRSN